MADLQRAPGTDVAAPPGLTLPLARATRVDVPELAGLTFLEVEAKSVLNRVTGMPFPWSINLYRGCSHACSYCLVPDTPVLMADGTLKPISELRVGDVVYGTVVDGRDRRFVPSTVLDTWRTTKPAHRVTLADGTTVVASGDHRFLSDRGWTHVAGAASGGGRRPHLTTSDRILGPGRLPSPPKQTAAYEVGYLTGVLRGEATPGTSACCGTRRTRVVHRFRLALADVEALDRSQAYLLAHGVPTDRFELTAATRTRRALTAIRTADRDLVERVRDLVAWPDAPDEEWTRGFLAGIFDAEGTHDGQVLRISTADEGLILATCAAMDRLGIDHVRGPAKPNGVPSVRVRGGLPMRLRFLLATGPAITRKRLIAGSAVEGAADTRVRAIQPLGLDLPMVDITTSTGDFVAAGLISHNCFARPTHTYLNLSATADFDSTIVVKVNAPEVLRRELARPSWRGEHVALGTNTDPYQRAEGRYALMPAVIDALATSRTPFSILTKGTLITRDIAALQAAAQQVPVAASMTIGMLDEDLWRSAEPGTPSPRARLEAVRRLNESGIPTGVMLAPIMPRLNDAPEQLRALAEAAVGAGATHVTPIALHLRPGVKEAFWPWLEAAHPDLVGHYAALYGAPGERGRAGLPDAVAAPLLRAVRRARDDAWRRRGGPPDPGAWPDRTRPGEQGTGHHVRAARPQPTTAEQLSLLT
jgi:DNA repair photolyase